MPFPSSKTWFISLLVIAFSTAIASEIKVVPFENAPFRFGLGSIVFFLALLIKRVPILLTGITTGITVVLFRTLLDVFFLEQPIMSAFFAHLPASAFYLIFALGLYYIPLDKWKHRPFYLAGFAIFLEIIANLAEQVLYFFIPVDHDLTWQSIGLIIVIAILRSLFVIGIYSLLTLEEKKKQLEKLTTIHSELYVEALYLQKSMEQIENLTSDSYQLYKELKSVDRTFSLEALRLSQEIHELKKDANRIYAGLSKITNVSTDDVSTFETILKFVKQANENYSAYLRKQITIDVHCPISITTTKQLPLLALLNNIVSNAIEAISDTGHISIKVEVTATDALFVITNDGPPIPENTLAIIFEPGYTTKYNVEGFAATGIGLSHVVAIVERLNGRIHVTSDEWTTFTVTIPLRNIL